ncbi:Gramicidin S synthase 2 [Mycobacteroides franklinii]|nr:Gramicidin S synthase 2 [Mycobacteroides franklinii]TDZ71253.1 Gramicidin S synthase 2 [Mycobacteroides franklinii]
MKADATRRLLSMDLGDIDEGAEWEEWGNRATLALPTTSVSIPELFAEQVVRDPEAVAVSFGDSAVTYRGLDEASNRLAQRLMCRSIRRCLMRGCSLSCLMPRRWSR